MNKREFVEAVRGVAHKEPEIYEWKSMWECKEFYIGNIKELVRRFYLLKGQETEYKERRRPSPEEVDAALRIGYSRMGVDYDDVLRDIERKTKREEERARRNKVLLQVNGGII